MTEVKKHSSKPQISIGDKFNTNCHGEIEVIYYNHANDIGVRFESGYERSATSGNIQKGKVKDPTTPTKTHARREDSYAIILGKIYTNSDGYQFKPTEYFNASKIRVVFESGYTRFATAQNINAGNIRDYMSPTKLGVGIIGDGKYNDIANSKEYKHWSSMLARTCDQGYKDNFPTYKNATVCADWLNFQVFAEWCRTQKNFDRKDFVLDKDIFLKGNKHYSPETCMFVPYKINNLFTKADSRRGEYPIGVYFFTRAKQIAACLRVNGVNVNLGYFKDKETAFYAYKEAKEKYIQDMAELFKEDITEKCYQALYNYKVEITD